MVNLSGINTLFPATRIEINIYGDDNVIDLSDGISISQSLHIIMGQDHPNFGKCNGALFAIGEHSSIESLSYITYNGGASCIIGKSCMFSNVTIYNTDAHPIFDLHTKEIINPVRGIKVGDHCWLGMNSTIMKNVSIPQGCIVGYGSIVAGSKEAFPENCIIAGIPARVIKCNINWDANGMNCGYIENKYFNF